MRPALQLTCPRNYGFGTFAKTPGIQAAMGKTFSGMLMALGKPFMVTGGGMLNNALITSPEQLVLDNEAIRFINRIRQPIVIDEESMGFEALQQGMARDGSLLLEEHALKHLRAGELMECGLNQWNRKDESGQENDPDIIEQVHLKVEEILASHKVEPFEPALEKELARIISEEERKFNH